MSYARKDLERIQPLVQALESHGWTVWWDMTLLPGDQFTTVIDQELAAARCVVVVWSTASVHSRWVRAEATEGADRDILIPVLIDEVRPPLEFRQFQTARFLEWHDAEPPPEFANVRERIIRLLEVSPLPAPSTPLDRLPEEERTLLRHGNPMIRKAMIYTLGIWLQSDDGDQVALARDVLQAHREEEEHTAPRDAVDEVLALAERVDTTQQQAHQLAEDVDTLQDRLQQAENAREQVETARKEIADAFQRVQADTTSISDERDRLATQVQHTGRTSTRWKIAALFVGLAFVVYFAFANWMIPDRSAR